MQDALRTFLLRKLDNLAKDDKCQITMISTWATELYLDKVLLHLCICIWIVLFGYLNILLDIFILVRVRRFQTWRQGPGAEGLILHLDFEKTYDRVDWRFLDLVMD